MVHGLLVTLLLRHPGLLPLTDHGTTGLPQHYDLRLLRPTTDNSLRSSTTRVLHPPLPVQSAQHDLYVYTRALLTEHYPRAISDDTRAGLLPLLHSFTHARLAANTARFTRRLLERTTACRLYRYTTAALGEYLFARLQKCYVPWLS